MPWPSPGRRTWRDSGRVGPTRNSRPPAAGSAFPTAIWATPKWGTSISAPAASWTSTPHASRGRSARAASRATRCCAGPSTASDRKAECTCWVSLRWGGPLFARAPRGVGPSRTAARRCRDRPRVPGWSRQAPASGLAYLERVEALRADRDPPLRPPAGDRRRRRTAVFFNFRADRARQLTAALAIDTFDGFARALPAAALRLHVGVRRVPPADRLSGGGAREHACRTCSPRRGGARCGWPRQRSSRT